MLSLLDIAERAWTGPRMDEMEWNMSLFHKVQELVKRHNLKAPSAEEVVVRDNVLVDAVWQAGIDFLVENGVYCLTTRRIIKLTEDEVKDTIRAMPSQVTIGEGTNAVTVKKRDIDGDRCHVVCCGGFHSPYREDLANILPKAFMEIPGNDFMEGFTFRVVDGREIHGMAMEAYAARRQVGWMREGARKAGRPGMGISFYPISLRASTMMAPLDPIHGLRRCDGALVTPLPDIKVEADLITTSIVYKEYGLAFHHNGNGHGENDQFAGGPDGFMVTGVAKSLAGWLIYRDCFTNMSPNIAQQAFNRHCNMIRFTAPRLPESVEIQRGELGTIRYLLSFAQYGIGCAAFGSHMEMAGGGRLEGFTPAEVAFVIECGEVARKESLKVDDAVELARNIRILADKECPIPPPKKFRGVAHSVSEPGWDGSLPTIRDVYDLVKMKPKESYQKAIEKARKIVKEAGLNTS